MNTAPHHQFFVKAKGPRRCEGETDQAEVQTNQVLQSDQQGTSTLTVRRDCASPP